MQFRGIFRVFGSLWRKLIFNFFVFFFNLAFSRFSVIQGTLFGQNNHAFFRGLPMGASSWVAHGFLTRNMGTTKLGLEVLQRYCKASNLAVYTFRITRPNIAFVFGFTVLNINMKRKSCLVLKLLIKANILDNITHFGSGFVYVCLYISFYKGSLGNAQMLCHIIHAF